MKIVIVGGVAGGASAAARLRRLDEQAQIVILERGEYISFANCGLPYYIGGTIRDKSALTLQTPESFRARFRVDVRVRHEAIRLDAEKRTVLVRKLDTGEEYEESFDDLILAPGAEPVRPPIPGADSSRVFTLRTIPDALAIKAFIREKGVTKAAVIGGGAIGVEMAENLAQAGLQVTIIEKSDHVIATLDYEMAADLHACLMRHGVGLALNNGVRRIEETGDGLVLSLDRGSVKAGIAVMSVGVRPESALAREAGLKVSRRGAVQVDQNMRTSKPHVYCVGDAAETRELVAGEEAYIPLAGPANKQGRVAADHICGVESAYRGTQGSSIVKVFDMAAACTGLNERAAREAKLAWDKTYVYSASHAGYYPGGSPISIKVLWEKKSLRLLGAQAVGYNGVDKRMDVLAALVRLGAKVTDLKELELCYAPPFGSAKDPVNMAGFVAENVIAGRVKQFFWDEVDGLPRDGSVTLLDVRTGAEVDAGRIGGFLHIPLDSLRDRLDQIPMGKPVYVHCHSGLRSYLACRILSGNGYDCYNLAGGYRLYASAAKARETEDWPCYEK